MKQNKTDNTKQEVEIVDDPFDIHIDGLDESAQEHREPIYAVIQWHNGSPKSAPGIGKAGGFFINSREQKKATRLPDWPIEQITFENEETEIGPAALTARIAVIRSRKCWQKKNADGKIQYFHWSQYKDGYTSKQQYLVAVEGCPEIFCLSVKGTTGQKIEAALNEFHKKVIAEGRKLGKQAYPPYAFWMQLQGGEFVTVGTGQQTSKTTPPRIVLPEAIDRAFLAKAFVGKDNLLAFQETFKESDTWAMRWNDAKELGKASEEDNGAQWLCLPHLADRYIDALAKLRAAKADVGAIVDGLTDELGGMPPEKWDDAQMQDALGALAFALKRATNKANVDGIAGIAANADDIPF